MRGYNDKIWFINYDDKLSFNLIEIEKKIRNGEITSDTMVLKNSNNIFHSKKWLKASEQRDLQKFFLKS
jgi:hypothetical protein